MRSFKQVDVIINLSRTKPLEPRIPTRGAVLLYGPPIRKVHARLRRHLNGHVARCVRGDSEQAELGRPTGREFPRERNKQEHFIKFDLILATDQRADVSLYA